jgi:hypothetical protein
LDFPVGLGHLEDAPTRKLGSLRYVAQPSWLRVPAASSRQFQEQYHDVSLPIRRLTRTEKSGYGCSALDPCQKIKA